MGFLLFMIAYVLFLPLSFINFLFVRQKGYFKDSAINIDKFGNREFRRLLNKTMKKSNGYEFGNIEETISSALGKNKRDETLSFLGVVICYILDSIDNNHCIKSINEF